MKNSLLLPALLFLSLALFSCMAGDIDSIHTVSPQGNREITISGSKTFKLDPIMVTCLVKTEKGEKDFSFEFVAADLNAETVEIEWRDNDKCFLTFKQKDGGKKIQHVDVTDGQVAVRQEIELSDESKELLENLH
ncbi:MAG: hypothetical protein H6581_06315 [Bacteroidia bacterium]|nr:hypothetical protein [Bacteroidia bacterium]